MVAVSKTTLVSLLFAVAFAHPGHDETAEIVQRRGYFKNNKRDLSHCAAKLKARGHEEKTLKRRQETVDRARVENGLFPKRHIQVRDLDEVVNTSHHSDLNVTATTASSSLSGVEDIIFSNSSCVLTPEGEIGPYYVTGEYVRKDIREDQEGVNVIIDGQFIDVNTCDPIPALYWDIWHCNATGVYGGVVGSGNGNEDDASNINSTFLRGLQPTDADGVAQFQTIFPGHYSGRASHFHVVAHQCGTILSNNTYTGGNITHIGQLFFDQDLITEVNLLEPYNQDTIAITLNADDKVVIAETEDSTSDPIMDYVLLGDTVSDGLFMWISIGVDSSENYTYSAASIYGADGGVAATNSFGDGTSSDNNTSSGNSTETTSEQNGVRMECDA